MVVDLTIASDFLSIRAICEDHGMRRTNWPVVIIGSVLIVLALVLFAAMSMVAPRSNDPGCRAW
jgi:hypothetical protein